MGFLAARCQAPLVGGVAQLGERLNGIQEVRGSIPLVSIATLTDRVARPPRR